MFVPWVNPKALEGTHAVALHRVAKRLTDYRRCERFSTSLYRRTSSWRGPDNVVHTTEVMRNPYWGVDRVTLCRGFRLNEDPQQGWADRASSWPEPIRHTLDIVPCDSAITCISCLGEM